MGYFTFSGQATKAVNGDPLSGCKITLVGDLNTETGQHYNSYDVESGAFGYYTFPPFFVTAVNWSVTHKGYTPQTGMIQCNEDTELNVAMVLN